MTPYVKAGLLVLLFPLALLWWPLNFALLAGVVYFIYKGQQQPSGAHLAKIIVQNHPYMGWIPGDSTPGGEAAALGLEKLPTWDDKEISVNINGSAAKLLYYPPYREVYETKPSTYTGLVVE